MLPAEKLFKVIKALQLSAHFYYHPSLATTVRSLISSLSYSPKVVSEIPMIEKKLDFILNPDSAVPMPDVSLNPLLFIHSTLTFLSEY